jgi:flagellar biosynthesis protein FliP
MILRWLLLLCCGLASPLAAVEAAPLQTPAGPVTSERIEAPAATAPAPATTRVLEAPGAPGQPGLTISFNTGEGAKGISSPVLLMLAITALSVAPAFLMMMTSFTRIIICLLYTSDAADDM